MKITELTESEFWTYFDVHSKKIFGETISYNQKVVRTSYEDERFSELRAKIKDRVEIYLGLFNEKNEIAGWSASYQLRTNELYMMNSAVFEDYRNQGNYKLLLGETVKKARKMGFQTITSKHNCTNNFVIVPKLKAGFKITGFEVSDVFGVLVQLNLNLNEIRSEILEFRVGQMRPSERIKKLLEL